MNRASRARSNQLPVVVVGLGLAVGLPLPATAQEQPYQQPPIVLPMNPPQDSSGQPLTLPAPRPPERPREQVLIVPEPPTAIAPPTSIAPSTATLPPPYGASIWKLDIGGYAHISYRWVQQPENYTLAGRNSGFQLNQARVLASVQYKNKLAVRVSFEGASEDRVNQSFAVGELTARLRDAYITWAPLRALRFSVGQMVTPWDLDSMRSDAELPFVTRSVPVEGVQPTEGFTTRGMGTDRNLGISIHSGFIPLGSQKASFRYAVFAGNGNGQNKVLNDDNIPAVFGRAEFAYWGQKGLPLDRVTPMYAVTDDWHRPVLNLGLAGHWNPRTAGNLPDLIRETDIGAAVDLLACFYGVELQGSVLYVRTQRDTLTQSPDLERFGWWAHARFTLPKIPVAITPGYRIGSYSPRAHLLVEAATPADAETDAQYGLLYHTVGLTVRPTRTFPLKIGASYTFTGEKEPNVLANDRFEADIVAVF